MSEEIKKKVFHDDQSHQRKLSYNIKKKRTAVMQLQIQKSPSSATELSKFSQNMSQITDPAKGSATEQM